ncbi:MAG: rhomboid family intramembrane serine protease [Anaerolineae bacterium]|nr:rhomboid family intramembrane serine protease [Anaerolineae bacterium]
MLPLYDLNPPRRVPYVTYILIGINAVIFLGQLTLSQRDLTQVFVTQAIVPASASSQPFSVDTILDFIRSMFFHGGWAHILGNMLYLWIFGDNVEDRLGKILYVIFYFACGFAAGIAQILIDPGSPIPLVGASGAIAGVLGAYLVLFPGVRVRGLILLGYFSQLTEIPALYVLGFWFVMQLFSGVTSLGVDTQSGGVAFFAHIGGFVFGAALAWIFVRLTPQPPPVDRREWVYQRNRRRLY